MRQRQRQQQEAAAAAAAQVLTMSLATVLSVYFLSQCAFWLVIWCAQGLFS